VRKFLLDESIIGMSTRTIDELKVKQPQPFLDVPSVASSPHFKSFIASLQRRIPRGIQGYIYQSKRHLVEHPLDPRLPISRLVLTAGLQVDDIRVVFKNSI